MTRKPAYTAFWAVLLLTLTACQTLGVPQADTFNKKALATIKALDGVVQTVPPLVASGRLEAPTARNIITQVEHMKVGVDLAIQAYDSDPSGSTDKLDNIITALTAIQNQLPKVTP